MSANPLLQPSPYAVDKGNAIGRDPRGLDPALLKGFPTNSPIKAIRRFCVQCSGGDEAEARKCVATGCPLWPFRMGTNVFHARRHKEGGEG